MNKTVFGTKKKAEHIHGKHLAIVVAACLITASAASFSTFFAFFLVPVSRALNIDRAAFSLVISITSITGLVFSIVWGQLLGKVGIRRAILICCSIVTIGFLGLAFSKDIVLFYIIAAVMGIGTSGGTTLCATSLVSNWFYERRGQVMAIVMSCLSIGGVLGGLVLPSIIASYGWQTGFIFTAVYFFILTIPGGIFIVRDTPQQVGLLPFGVRDIDSASTDGGSELLGISFKRGMQSPVFYLLFIGIAMVGFPVAFVQHMSAYGTDNGLAPEAAGLLIVVVSIVSIFLSILTGRINDKLGPLKTTIMLEVVFFTAFLAFFFVTGFIPILIAGIIFSFGIAFTSVMPPIIVSALFGPKDFSKFYGLLTPAMAVGFIVGTPLLGSIYDQTHSYNVAFLISIVSIVLGIICITISLKYKKN